MCILLKMNTRNIFKMKSGIYRCPDSIKNFKIRVTIKKGSSSVINSTGDNLNISQKESKIISWQEKVFSHSEAEFFGKKSNCFTDLELEYHNIVSKSSQTFGRIFTYVKNDDFQPDDGAITSEIQKTPTELYKQMSNLYLQTNSVINHKAISGDYDLKKSLNKSITNPCTANSYETMYIMADLGDSETNTNVWMKSEHILCCIKFDEINKLLWVYPDFCRSENDLYHLEIDLGGKMYYEYTIENVSLQKNVEVLNRENNILRKINKRSQESKFRILGKHFSSPPKNMLYFYIFFEIKTAKNFEYDNIYVQYFIDLPKNWGSMDETSLFGTTQTCITTGTDKFANFGHFVDVSLQYKKDDNFDGITHLPVIYFQIISHDYWGRYRTEGLTYTVLPVFNTGIRNISLECIRICPRNPSGQLRRYFIGDYFNIDDVTWIAISKEHEDKIINKYGVETIGTGTIEVRLNILNQSNVSKPSNIGDDSENANSLVKSVSDVISAFRKAREKMLLARKNVEADN